MPSFDFTTLRDRSLEGSSKWGAMLRARPDTPAGTVPFSVADMDFVTPPPIVETLQREAAALNLGYAEATPAYREAVLGWQERRHGWRPAEHWLRESPGVVPALYAAVQAFTAPGDRVIIQEPVYYPFAMAIEDNGRRVASNPLVQDEQGAFAMDFEGLEALASQPDCTAMILCSPHNPVGRVWTRAELERLCAICVEHGVFLIADEIHEDLVQPPHRHTTIALAMPEGALDRCLVCTAPSKSFNIAGLQCSNIFVPGECEREAFARAQALAGFHALNCLAYKACEAAYDRCEPWLEAVLQVVARNYHLLRAHCADAWPQTTLAPLEGTYLAWIDLRWVRADQERLTRAFEDHGLFFDPGDLFGPQGAGFVRWNLGCPTQVLQDALPRFDAALQSLCR